MVVWEIQIVWVGTMIAMMSGLLSSLLLLRPEVSAAHRAIRDTSQLLQKVSDPKWFEQSTYVRYDLASEEDQEEMSKGIACYCKKVASMADCPDEKEGLDLKAPNRYRWYHAEEGQCCKMSWTSMFTYVGWSYKRQDTMDLCTSEVRTVPQAACCLLKDDYGSIGLRVNQTTAISYFSGQSDYYSTKVERQFFKSFPRFEFEEITGGVDHTGRNIDAEEVRDYIEGLRENGRFKNDLDCAQIVENDTEPCLLRHSAASECCCHQATLTEAERCLTVEGAASESEVEPVTVVGEYTERSGLGGKREGMIHHPPGPNARERERLPDVIESVDPEVKDDPNTALDEETMVFAWARSNQWTSTCVEHKQVAHVRTQSHSKRYRSGTHHYRVGKISHSRPIYRTKHWQTYHQQHTSKCISYKYTRTCPAGKALYEKQFPEGSCATEPSEESGAAIQLIDLGAMNFMCPEDYKSGTPGAVRFTDRCRCATKC